MLRAILVWSCLIGGLILSVIAGPIGVIFMTGSLFFLWIYYMPEGQRSIKKFWEWYVFFYFVGSCLCVFRFGIFAAFCLAFGGVITIFVKLLGI